MIWDGRGPTRSPFEQWEGLELCAVEVNPQSAIDSNVATGESLVTALVLVGAGFLTIVTGVLSHRRKLPRNWILGLRTRSTLKNDDAWFAAHEAAGGFIAGAGVILTIVGVVALVLEPSDAVILSGTTVGVIVLVVGGIIGVRATKNL